MEISRVEKLEKSLVINKLNSKKSVRKFTFKSVQDLRDVYGIISSIWKTQPQAVKRSSVAQLSPPGSPASPRVYTRSVLPTKEDWEMILKGARLHAYKKGDVIVPEASECRKIYKIYSGKCTVEKSTAEGHRREIANVLKDNDLYGEITFLLGGLTNLSLVAQSDVEVHTLEASYIHALLNSRPVLAPKFYRYISHALLKRVTNFRDKASLNSSTPKLPTFIRDIP